jgi:hypothetical protein
MVALQLDVAFGPPWEDVEGIERGLDAFNLANMGGDGIYDRHRVAVVARDGRGEVFGRIHGELCWAWLNIATMRVAQTSAGSDLFNKAMEGVHDGEN